MNIVLNNQFLTICELPKYILKHSVKQQSESFNVARSIYEIYLRFCVGSRGELRPGCGGRAPL